MSAHAPDKTEETAETVALRPAQFRLFRELIYDKTGISLGDNKMEFVQSRLRKRLRANNLNSFRDYYDLVQKDKSGDEMQQLINRVTTNKTNFFREMHHFDHLRDKIFTRLIDEADRGLRPQKLRIWCAASSTGEEPYSLAITVADTFSRLRGWDIRILASDIDTSVLEKARNGQYRMELSEEIPPDAIQKHFKVVDGQLQIHPSTAGLVTFRQVNLLDQEWPIRTQFDVIFIRNVLIYFDAETQNGIMRHMSKYLKPDGSLFIGHSESLSSLASTYKRVGNTVYQHANYQPATEKKRFGGGAASPARSAIVQPEKKPVQPKLPRNSIVVGDVFVSARPAEVATTLGSCIAVCLFDTSVRFGGMNHFALPSGVSCNRSVASFGVHAMELLINKIMSLGGDRRFFQAKVFGGAHVMGGEDEEDNIGQRNAEFICEFLNTEAIPIISKHLGGDRAMQVLFETHTGRARVKLLDQSVAADVNKKTKQATKPVAPEPVSDITLF